MTARTYYTLCVWYQGETPDDPGCWTDEFGDYSRRAVEHDKAFAYDHYPRGHVKIVSHLEGTAHMMAARDALPTPKNRRII